MTTLLNRTNTAVVVIDVQNGVMDGAFEREAVIGRIGALVERARAAQVPVIWVRHNDEELQVGSDAWQYVPELQRTEQEAVVEKSFGDAFEDTSLEQLLHERSVGHLILAGAQSDQCIRCTLHGAFTRGYDVTLAGDAHTTVDLSVYGAPPPQQVIAHTNLYWRYQAAPGRTAAVTDAADITFTPSPAD